MSKPKTRKRPPVLIYETNQPSPAVVAEVLRYMAAVVAKHRAEQPEPEAEPLRPAA